MKITKITICNLASIAGEFTIDFEQEPLRSAGIFAISGPTGSGKSTILDAMCLAFYDKIPRFEHSAGTAKISDNGKADISQTDVRNILRRGATEGKTEVEFIGSDELRYLSSWTIRRSYGRADGNLQAQSIRVYNLSTNEELQGTKTDILNQLVRLIGLTYTQFTRTVLLAQNDFATFLKSNENEKAELLEKLTGTDVYSKISIEVYKRYRIEDQSLSAIKQSMGDIQLIPEDQLESRSILLKQTIESIAKQRNELDLTKKKAEAFTEINRFVEEDIKQKKQLEDIQKNLVGVNNDISDQQQRIIRFEEQTEAKEKEIQEAAELDAVFTTKQEGVNGIQLKLKRIDSDVVTIQNRLKRELTLVERINLEQKEIYQKYKLPSDKSIDDILVSIELTNKEVQSALEGLKQEKNKIDIDAIYISQKELSLGKELFNKLKADYSIFIDKSNLLDKQSKRLLECDKSLIVLNTEQDALKLELVLKGAAFEQAKEAFHRAQLQVSESVEKLRQQLKAGDECPVCGSTQHVFTNKAVEDMYKLFEDAYKKAESELASTNKRFTTNEANMVQVTKDSANLKIEISELRKLIETLTKAHKDAQFNSDFIESQSQVLQKKEAYINTVLSTYSELQKKSDALLARQKKAQDLHNVLTRISAQIKETSASYKLVEQELAVVSKNRMEISKEWEEAAANLKAIGNNRAKLLKGKSVVEVRSFILEEKKRQNDLLANLQKTQLSFSESQARLEGSLNQLKEQISKLRVVVDGLDVESVSKSIQVITSELDILEKKKSELEYEIKKNDENAVRFKELSEKLNKQTLIFEKWAKLNDLIGSAKGDKFKVIAQSYTLKILLLHANQHLSYLARRYQLKQIDESLSLQIIDRDMLNQERTILSLSGGESFLISLALALGLSSLSSNNLKVESLFIDEGFGSLDMDSLRTAMDALEQLQMQGRKIGVISHVQEMSERIPVQIRLVREEQGKSKIEVG